MSLLTDIVRDYKYELDITANIHGSMIRYEDRFQYKSYSCHACDEILEYVNRHDPFDPVWSLESYIRMMKHFAIEYPRHERLFTINCTVARDILERLECAM